MLNVSPAFKTAVLAPERQWKAKVQLSLFDNSSVGITTSQVSASSTLNPLPVRYTQSPFPVIDAFDGIGALSYTPAVADPGGSVAPSATLFPVPDDGSGGWFGNVAADASGNVGPTQYLTVNYNTSKIVQAFTLTCDPNLGYPVNYTIDYSTDGTTWINIFSVTGNASYIRTDALASTITAQYARIGITKWSKPNYYPQVYEWSPGWTITTDDFLADRIKSISVTRESHFDDEASLPIGNYQAGECVLELANDDGVFYQRNTASPYYGYLKPNRKIAVWLGLFIGVGQGLADSAGYEWVPVGTFYTNHFQGSHNSPTVTVECWDRVKRLQERSYQGTQVLTNQTISQLMTNLVLAAGFGPNEYLIDATTDTIDYSYFSKNPYWKHMVDLASAETGYVMVNAENQLQFKNRYFYWSTRLTQNVASAATTLTVGNALGVKSGDTIYVMDGTNTDTYTVSSVDATNAIVTLNSGAVRTYTMNNVNGTLIGPFVMKALPVITLTLDNTLSDLSDEYQIDKMKNKISVKVNPLTLAKDAHGVLLNSTVQWQAQTAFSLAASGQTITELGASVHDNTVTTVEFGQTDAQTGTGIVDEQHSDTPVIVDASHKSNVSVLIAPVTGHDSSGNPTVGAAVVDPLASNPTADLPNGGNPMDNTTQLITKTWTDANGNPISGNVPYAWGGYLTLRNTSATTEYRVLQVTIDGFPMERKSKTEYLAQDLSLITEFGEKLYTLDSPFITSVSQATGIGNNLLNTFRDPTSPITFSMPVRGLPHIEVGDRVTVSDPFAGLADTALNNHFYIVRYQMKFDGGLDITIDGQTCL